MAVKIWKVTGIALLSIVGLVAVIVGGVLAYRAYRQHQNVEALAIHTAHGIDESLFVKVGDIDQWITIRGQDRSNPVVLFLHGGPGEPSNLIYAAQFIPWTRDFTIVQWDQRGAGKTFARTGESIGPTLTIERMTQDGLELAELLKNRLHKDKLILVGHSWGTVLGTRMAKARPDLFYAYVGTGQVVNFQRNEAANYRRVLDKARASGNQAAVNELQTSGPPPYRTFQALIAQRKWAATYDGVDEFSAAALASARFAPGYSVRDLLQVVPSIRLMKSRLLGDSLDGPFTAVNLESLGLDFSLPLFVFAGPDDYVTSPDLAKAYVDSLAAPHKEFVLLRTGGHFAIYTHTDLFLKELATRVRPLAIATKQ